MNIEIAIKGEAKEIAELVQRIQSQQTEKLLMQITEIIQKNT